MRQKNYSFDSLLNLVIRIHNVYLNVKWIQWIAVFFVTQAQRHGIKGIVVMERNSETQVYYAQLQKLAVIELGLPVVPVRSLDEVPQLLSQMVMVVILLNYGIRDVLGMFTSK